MMVSPGAGGCMGAAIFTPDTGVGYVPRETGMMMVKAEDGDVVQLAIRKSCGLMRAGC